MDQEYDDTPAAADPSVAGRFFPTPGRLNGFSDHRLQ